MEGIIVTVSVNALNAVVLVMNLTPELIVWVVRYIMEVLVTSMGLTAIKGTMSVRGLWTLLGQLDQLVLSLVNCRINMNP